MKVVGGKDFFSIIINQNLFCKKKKINQDLVSGLARVLGPW